MTEELVAFAAQEALGTTAVECEGRDDRPDAALARGCRWAPRSPSTPASTRSEATARRARALRAALDADGLDTAPTRPGRQLVDHVLSHFIEPHLIAADVPRRLPGRAVAAVTRRRRTTRR